MSVREAIGERADWSDIAARILTLVVVAALLIGACVEAVRA